MVIPKKLLQKFFKFQLSKFLSSKAVIMFELLPPLVRVLEKGEREAQNWAGRAVANMAKDVVKRKSASQVLELSRVENGIKASFLVLKFA